MAISNTLAMKYANLIDEDVLPRETENPGSKNIVYFTGEHAIKVPDIVTPETSRILTHEQDIANGLREVGINVPEMHGVHDFYNLPFLVMQRLNILTLDKLTRAQKAEAIKQYTEQRTLAEQCGFTSRDLNPQTNYAYDPKQGKGFFFDFADWRKAA